MRKSIYNMSTTDQIPLGGGLLSALPLIWPCTWVRVILTNPSPISWALYACYIIILFKKKKITHKPKFSKQSIIWTGWGCACVIAPLQNCLTMTILQPTACFLPWRISSSFGSWPTYSSPLSNNSQNNFWQALIAKTTSFSSSDWKIYIKWVQTNVMDQEVKINKQINK